MEINLDDLKRILTDGRLAESEERWIQEREAWIRQKAECVTLGEKLAEAREDSARLDWLEGEMAYEQRCIEHGQLIPSSLFRRNVPITRAAIDAARGKPIGAADNVDAAARMAIAEARRIHKALGERLAQISEVTDAISI